MKKNILLFAMLFSIISSWAYPGKVEVTQSKALEMAKQAVFNQSDAEFYLINNSNNSQWTIFVDLQPGANWEHDCCIVYVPRTADNQFDLENLAPLRENLKYPPADNMVHLSAPGTGSEITEPSQPVEEGEGNSSEFEANVDIQPDMSAASRTHAIILSGGINKNSNNIRYWNDCSFIYKTLTERYAIPKNQIYPILADGDDPSEDTRLLNNTYKSQDLDLDEDGVDEISMSASKSNIEQTLTGLLAKLKQGDHLFLYVIDHGGTNGNDQSYICLWNGENLQDYELAEMLRPFSEKGVKINVVLGQCYSGGFIDDLTMEGCVVATASRGDESSWSRSTGIHDEFVYQWTCAINGLDYYGKSVKYNPDTNNDGYISMEETFNYAKANDKYHVERDKEHPQYASTPTSIGQNLAFNKLDISTQTEQLPTVDLFIKDNEEDTGVEPNTTTDIFWASPSIWVRNKFDGIEEYENPVYSPDHQVAYIYVKVHNRGKEDYTGGKFLRVYWGQASTGFTDKVWKGRELYKDKYPTGGSMDSKRIDPIEAGGERVLYFTWPLPELLCDFPDGNFHFCLAAKIMDISYDDGYEEGKSYFNMSGSNDIASRNLTIIKQSDIYKAFNVYVRNISDVTASYNLELVPLSMSDEMVYSEANIELEMSPTIYDAWADGGFESTDIEMPVVYSRSNSVEQNIVQFLTPQSKLENLAIPANEFDVVKLKFDFFEFPNEAKRYTFDLVQKDLNGNIIGGERFIVEPPVQAYNAVEINTTNLDDGSVKLSAQGEGFNKFKWVDARGTILSDKESVCVTPSSDDCDYKVIALTEDGKAATNNISLTAAAGIKSVNVSNGNIKIDLKTEASENSSVTVTSLTADNKRVSAEIAAGSKSLVVDTSTLSNGLYVVSYSVDGNVIDRRKITLP